MKYFGLVLLILLLALSQSTLVLLAQASPSNLSLEVSSPSQILLNWTDNADDESRFHIERSLDGSSWVEIAVLEANSTSFVDSELDCETEYFYRLRVYRSSDSSYSAYSNVANVQTSGCTCDYQMIVRASVNSTTQEEGDGASYRPVISTDGRYTAYLSYALNLWPVHGDDPAVFVFDNLTCETELISVDSSGTPANGDSRDPSISADGRYVAFMSHASNLATGANWDIYRHDRDTGETELVSIGYDSLPGNNASNLPSISSDGRYIAFCSFASNLVEGVSGLEDSPQIYLRDMENDVTTVVSVNSDGIPANMSNTCSISISGDGRYVAFESGATNLIETDNGDFTHIYLHDRQTGETIRASVSSTGVPSNDRNMQPYLTVNSRYLVFESDATNLVSNDTNGQQDVFVRDLVLGTTQRVSIGTDGTQGNGLSYNGSISADGRSAMFISEASNLVENDTNGLLDLFIHDLELNVTYRVFVDNTGEEFNNDDIYYASLSADGNFIALSAAASNLIANDTNNQPDIFVYNTLAPSLADNLLASPVSQNEIQLNWQDNSTTETAYIVERSDAGLSNWQTISLLDANSSSYLDRGLACNSSQDYRVKSIAEDLTSAYTNVSTAQTPACQAPGAPELILPLNTTATRLTAPLFLSWVPIGGGVSYQLEIDDNPNFASPNLSLDLGYITYNLSTLLPDNIYYWRVRSINSIAQVGPWSLSRSFIVDTIAPPAPMLIAPLNNDINTGRPSFSWNASTSLSPVQYELQVGITNPPQSVISLSSATSFSPAAAFSSTSHYWRVRAIDSAGNYGEWSEVRSFSVLNANGSLPAPSLNFYTTSTPSLSWNSVSWASEYELQLSNTNNFVQLEYSIVVPANTLFVTTSSLAEGLHYWRVRARNATRIGNWSATASFIIDLP
jgi:hypothetical protein